MNIVYLTWGETPRSYGIFGSQVIGQFVATKKLMADSNFTLISAVPIIHSGLVREKLSYKSELNKVRELLGNIDFIRIPIYATQNFINSTRRTFKFMHLNAHAQLAKHLISVKADVVHCRSYHATYAALIVRSKYKLNYKVIFDARGLWPEEIALKKNLDENSEDYKFFKTLEKWLLDNSNAAVSVSDSMKIHYESMTKTQVKNIYLSAAAELFKPDIIKNSNHKTLIYVGALSDDTWHKINGLFKLYAKFRLAWPETKLIIVTTSNHNKIREEFSQFADSEVQITSTKTAAELSNYLSIADFACLPYFSPSTSLEKIVSNSVLAVKTAEYLSAGLPVLCNMHCGGAAKLIEINNLGISYNPDTLEELSHNKLTEYLDSQVIFRAIDAAAKLFSYTSNADKYSHLYQSLRD